jgi:predicted DNA-binding protein (UPF0251 family)
MPIVEAFGPLPPSAREPGEVVVTLDEFEAVRLADLEELYQERAAEKMGVSRPTFSRIIDSAHRKIAEALVSGKGLRIEGGSVRMEQSGSSLCPRCGRETIGTCECPRCREDCGTPGAQESEFLARPARQCKRRQVTERDSTEAGCPEHLERREEDEPLHSGN